MKLMIIESPGKVEKLSSILGPDFKIVASIGLVRDLPESGISVAPPDFRPTYVLSERGQSVIERIKRLIPSASEIYLATDPDREGESISWHLKEVLGLKTAKRVTFNSITPDAVRAAFAAPRAIDVRVVAAQEARRVFDRLVGYMVSPEISRRHGSKLSAGRVQSVAVRILVDRERAIRSFRKTTHFGAELAFGSPEQLRPPPLNDREAELCSLSPDMRPWQAKDGAQAGHPGVTPTHWDVISAGETDAQKGLYSLIRLRALASQLHDARYAVRVAVLAGVAADGRPLSFEARGRVLIDRGWMGLMESADDEDEDDAADDDGGANAIPELQAGQELQAIAGKVTVSETKPPKRYTQASLIKKMEAEGIGRPSTYASIMGTIMKRDYAQVKQKMLVPTERGEAVVDMMAGRFGFMDLDFTRQIETELDLIASGRQNYRPAVEAFYSKLEHELSALAAAVPVKPSEGMILAVRGKAKREGIEVNDDMLLSAEACRAFLGPRQTGEGGAYVPRPASEKQIELIKRYVDEGKIAAPSGYPDKVTAKDASAALEKAFKRRSKKTGA